MKKNYLVLSLSLSLLGITKFAEAQTTETFNYTGDYQMFTVPSCVSQVTITCTGANGANGVAVGNSPGGIGGLGAVVTGSLNVTPGQVLFLYVGGAASGSTGGYNGGGSATQNAAGGGGASDVRVNSTTLSDRIMVAGGGGGGGNSGTVFGDPSGYLPGGNGGNGGDNGANGVNSTGGGGGYGAIGATPGQGGYGCGGFASKPGSVGLNGVGGVGGAAPTCCSSISNGGCGGGGYLGGAGGGGGGVGTVQCGTNHSGSGGGGAGGTNYVSSSFVNTSTGVASVAGNGSIAITYTVNNLPTVTSALGASICDEGSLSIEATASEGVIDWYDSPISGNLLATGNTYNTSILSTSAVYYAEANNNGCLSLDRVAVNATVNYSTASSMNDTACDSYVWNGNTYTSSGLYTYTTMNAIGCDSVVSLNLIIKNSSTSSMNDTACDSYVWNGNTYTSSGLYTYTTTNAVGCDSVVTLNLEIKNSQLSNETAAICEGDSIMLGGAYQKTEGTYTDVYTGANGCDSTIVTVLTVNALPDVTTTFSGDTIIVNETGAFTYQWIDCTTNDTISGANDQWYLPTVTGNYSVFVMNYAGCFNISECQDVIITGVKSIASTQTQVVIYPNPSVGALTIGAVDIKSVKVTNTLGKVVYQAANSDAKSVLTIDITNQANGMYIIEVVTAKGITKQTIVKQ